MSHSTDQSLNDLIYGLNVDVNFDLSPLPDDLLAQYSHTLDTNAEFADVMKSVFDSSSSSIESPAGYSPENNSNHQELSNLVSQAVILPNNMQLNSTQIQIIAQPYYGTKLRYRSDYEKNENRLGVLKNRNKDSSYQGPAIRIPQAYLNSNSEYFVRISLVTIEYAETGLHYFHPYELEHPLNEQMNDRPNNSVWFPIQSEDCTTGIKSFSSLRIVKKRATDLKACGDLRVFDCHDPNLQNNSLQQSSNPKETISKYNLEKSQLAFTIGQKLMNNNQFLIYPTTTVYSEEMIEGVGKESEVNNDVLSPDERSIPSPPSCRVYKYAPRYGFGESQEDMVIFLTNKLEPKKYGELKVTFECNTSKGRWSEQVLDVDIKDRMVSFKTPIYQDSFDIAKTVDIVLQQDNRYIDTIKYYYLSTLDTCSKCQSNTVRIQTNAMPNIPTKRPAPMITNLTFVTDAFVPDSDNSSKLQQSLSEPAPDASAPSSTISTSNNASLPSINHPETTINPHEQLMNAFSNGIKSLFIDNDYNSFFRICRSFLRKSPDILHNAIINNNSEFLLKFLSLTTNEFLQQKNQFGETIFLHALRLNRIEIIQILLENKHSKILIKDIDKNNNNIFHIIALNSTISFEMIDLLMNYFDKNSINIQENFDSINQDNLTPLQLSIIKNNFNITKLFCKYFNKNIHRTNDLTGDNLIHLAIRYSNLTMIKYLIEDEKLFEQGKQSNFKMKPIDLAESLQYNDIIEYFQEIYPEEIIEENDDTNDNDD